MLAFILELFSFLLTYLKLKIKVENNLYNLYTSLNILFIYETSKKFIINFNFNRRLIMNCYYSNILLPSCSSLFTIGFLDIRRPFDSCVALIKPSA